MWVFIYRIAYMGLHFIYLNAGKGRNFASLFPTKSRSPCLVVEELVSTYAGILRTKHSIIKNRQKTFSYETEFLEI